MSENPPLKVPLNKGSKAASEGAAKDTRNTYVQLIEAAERLFGQRGLDGVTLKEITRAAGQRNESALHYHFGSKRKLVQAIFAYRGERIDRRRVALLDELERDGKLDDLRAVIEATMRPVAEQMRQPDGHSFILFAAQIANDPASDIPAGAAHSPLQGIQRANDLLGAILGDLPPDILRLRLRALIELTFSTFSTWLRTQSGNAHQAVRHTPEAHALFVSNFIDSLAAMMSAPLSPQTKRALKQFSQDNGP